MWIFTAQNAPLLIVILMFIVAFLLPQTRLAEFGKRLREEEKDKEKTKDTPRRKNTHNKS